MNDTLLHGVDDQHAPRGQRDLSRVILAVGVASLVFSCLALVGAGYLYLNHGNGDRSTSALSTQSDAAKILAAVSILTDLPSDETPKIVPISDLAQLKNQPFFARSVVGNMLIVYVKNHLAVLYDPSVGKIVNMSKISTVVVPTPVFGG